MAEKVTKMVLKVDLQCPCCYKKIKKILAKFPEIRSHIYDEKQNTVTITVVCCNPEKIRCKLLCKGGKTIKCIEIIKEPPPNPSKDKKVKKDDKEKKDDDKPTGKTGKTPPPSDPETPPKSPKRAPPNPLPAIGYPPSYPIPVCCGPCYEGNLGGPCYHGYGRPVPIRVPVAIIPKWVPAHGCPPINPVPDCCGPCSEGNPGGPCYHGYGRQVPCYDGYWYGSGSGGCTSM
ncbi:hypothetical protein Vadar_010710 [Vaccinium darrowii]|uniref:Uncharacterized protein n=1 Tax=Vaccinium darrowii TaxID=229202 RepID=A0ACB7X9I2_9ERIC|nr:hypothetical protein Vadar_010710 [Vaccinium darrowii]